MELTRSCGKAHVASRVKEGDGVEDTDRVLTVKSLKGQGGTWDCCRAESPARRITRSNPGGRQLWSSRGTVDLNLLGPGSVQSREDEGT